MTIMFLVDIKKLLIHSVSPIIIAEGLILIYEFLLSRPRGLSSTTMPRLLHAYAEIINGHGSRKLTHFHLCYRESRRASDGGQPINQFIWIKQPRPVESHSGARENIVAGPYHPPRSVCLEIETPKASRGRKHGERCSLTIRLGVRRSVVSSPSGVRGAAPAENGFYAYFRSEKSHLEHHFQYF